jgi:hypothetical protein
MTNDELYALLRDFRRQLVDNNAPHHVVLEYTLMMTRLMNKVCGNGA